MASSICRVRPGSRRRHLLQQVCCSALIVAGFVQGSGATSVIAALPPPTPDPIRCATALISRGLPVAPNADYYYATVDDQLRSPREGVWMAADVTSDKLLGRWAHSHEEGQSNGLVFRPADFAFPPSRGRTTLVFAAGGDLQVEGPGPDDRRRTTSGRWSLQGNILTTTAPGWSGAFDIEAVDERALVLRRRP
jgi:hypothetical protein